MLLLIGICGLIAMTLLTSLAPRWTTTVLMRAAQRLAGLRRRQLICAGFRIVYLEGGRGEPLLLLHGAGADKNNFALVGRRLRRRYRVIIPDLPGYGESDKPAEAGYRTLDQVQRLITFMDALGIQQIHLGGNSMGGLIAGAFAAQHPERVRTLWLLAPAGVKAAIPSELMQKLHKREPLPIFARNSREMRAVLAFVTHRTPYLPGFMIRAMAAEQREQFAMNQAIVFQLLEGPWLDEMMQHRPSVPTLIVWGDRDRALDVSGASVLHQLLPDSRLIIMPEIGHVPMIEAPTRTADDYVRFRNSLAQREA